MEKERNLIDKNSLIPIYHQISTILKERIEKHEWGINDKFPSESELSEQFNVSRLTIRRALNELIHHGLIKSFRGLGSYVQKIPEPIIHDFSLPSILYSKLGKKGIMLKAQIIELRYQEPVIHINESLKIDNSEKLVYIYRVFLLDDKAIALNQSWLPSKLVDGLVEGGLIDNHLSFTLSNVYNLKPVHIENTLSAAKGNAKEIALLDISFDTPLIIVSSISYLPNDIPLEYSKTAWIGDRVNFHFSM